MQAGRTAMNQESDQGWEPVRELRAQVPPPPPRDLPDLRLSLLRHWEPGALFDQVTRAKHRADLERMMSAGSDVPWFDRERLRLLLAGEDSGYRSWEYETLKHAALYWVSQ